jgi:polyisoprenoid-binding protein YceI
MNKVIVRLGALVLLAATGAWAQNAAPVTGSVSVVAKQMNVPVEGKFKTFTGQVHFDPANLAASKATLEVETASIDFGEEDFNYELRTKTWFDVKGFPKATFVSSKIKPLDKDRYEVSGKLTIKGKSADVTVPVSVRADGASRLYEGTLPIKRTTFDVGTGEWRDTSVVADDVQIRFRLTTPAK